MGFFSRLFSRFFTSKEEKKRIQLQQEYADIIKSLNSNLIEYNQKKLEIWETAKKSAIEGRKVDVLLSLRNYRAIEIRVYQIKKHIYLIGNQKEAISKQQPNENLDDEIHATCYLIWLPAPDIYEDLQDQDSSEEQYYYNGIYGGAFLSVDSLYQKLMEEIAQEQGDSGTDEDASDKTGSSPNETEELSKESSDITQQENQVIERLLNVFYNKASDNPNPQLPEK